MLVLRLQAWNSRSPSDDLLISGSHEREYTKYVHSYGVEGLHREERLSRTFMFVLRLVLCAAFALLRDFVGFVGHIGLPEVAA